MFTVLYAPTWEGWTDERPALKVMGLKIVQALLEYSPQIRVIYKPHPLTGNRDRSMLGIHEAIVALIERSNDRLRRAENWPAEAAAGEADRQNAAAELSRVAARMAELTRGGDAGPAGLRGCGPARTRPTLARDSKPGAADDAEWQRLNEAWHAAYWRSQAWRQHQVITGPLPVLYECFNQADLLISDISSVVSDFLAAGKPYIVTNPEGLDEDEFREKFPTAGAAYLLGAGLRRAARHPGPGGRARRGPARGVPARTEKIPPGPGQTRRVDPVLRGHRGAGRQVARPVDPDPGLGSAPLAAPLAQTVGATPEA